MTHISPRIARAGQPVAALLRKAMPAKHPRQWPFWSSSTASFSSAIAHRAPMRRLMASVMISTCLALPEQGAAQDAASDTASHAPASQSSASDPGTSEALLRVIALRQALEAQVNALSRLVAYQKELLDLAKTSGREAVLRARRQRQSCHQDIGSAALCDALRVSFSDDRPDETTRQDVVLDVGQDRGVE